MTMWAIANKFKIASIPITYRDRPKGSYSKVKTIRDGIKILKTIKNFSHRRQDA
jgi:hypothetical protein